MPNRFPYLFLVMMGKLFEDVYAILDSMKWGGALPERDSNHHQSKVELYAQDAEKNERALSQAEHDLMPRELFFFLPRLIGPKEKTKEIGDEN